MNNTNIEKFYQLVKLLDFRVKQRSGELLWGQRLSVFKGQGMEYNNLRPYQRGDDIRHINWKVSARMNKPYVKEFIQESELQSFIIADTSSSMFFGHDRFYKYHKMMDLVAILGLLMIDKGDKLGLVFNDHDEKLKFIEPGKDLVHIKMLLKKLSEINTDLGREFNLEKSIKYLVRHQYKRGNVIIISDLLDQLHNVDEFLDLLKKLKIKNEVYIIQTLDKFETSLITTKESIWKDVETNNEVEITIDEGFQKNYQKRIKMMIENMHSRLKKIDIRSVTIMSNEDPVRGLLKIFRSERF